MGNKRHRDFNTDDMDISLESILAEYKSEAYIAGEKKTPKDVLDARIKQILEETSEDYPSADKKPEAPIKATEAARPEASEIRVTLPADKPEDAFIPDAIEITDADDGVTDYTKYASAEADKSGDEDGIYDDGDDYDVDYENSGILKGLIGKLGEASEHRKEKKERQTSREREERERYDKEEGSYDEEELKPDDMTLVAAAMHYGKGINSYQMRGTVSIIISLVMLLLCLAYGGSFPLPGFLSQSVRTFAGVLLLLQLIVMYLGRGVFATGLLDIIRLKIGAESLVSIACIVSALDSVRIIISGDMGSGLPYNAVAAFAVGCGILGTKLIRNAMKISLRAAAASPLPYAVTGKYGLTPEGYTLHKSRTGGEGFLRKTQQKDFAEYVYGMMAPLLLVMALIFALLASALKGMPESFLHYFAALTAISASFAGLISYGLPYSMLAKKLMRVGAAIAGWGGASDIDDAYSMIVTDSDVFPAGTVSISGIRVFLKSDAEKVISYTGSLIKASDSGLSDCFVEIMRRRGYPTAKVRDFSCYEGGGIGALVKGEHVIVGSSNFMNLMGIRLPQNLSLKNAVFTAIDSELVGVFAINYVPINSVQEALISLLRTKIKPLFAVRDFNVTPLMLKNKFKISTENVDFLSVGDRYALSSVGRDPHTRPLAVLSREGLGPLSETVTGGKRLKRAVRNNVLFSVAATVIGQLLIFYFCWGGYMDAASPANIFTYMFMCLIPVLIISRAVK